MHQTPQAPSRPNGVFDWSEVLDTPTTITSPIPGGCYNASPMMSAFSPAFGNIFGGGESQAGASFSGVAKSDPPPMVLQVVRVMVEEQRVVLEVEQRPVVSVKEVREYV